MRVCNISPRSSAMVRLLALAGSVRITMGLVVLQRFVIGTELLTVRTQISSAVHMFGLNVLIKVGFMPGRVLTIYTEPATIHFLLHPRQDLLVSVLPTIIFT